MNLLSLEVAESVDVNWLKSLKDAFISCIISTGRISLKILPVVFSKMMKIYESNSEIASYNGWKKVAAIKKFQESDEVSNLQKFGSILMANYADRLSPNSKSKWMSELTSLQKKTQNMRKSDNGNDSYDWFGAIMLIIYSNVPETLTFLNHFTMFNASLLWNRYENDCDIPILYSKCCHLIESIMDEELLSAFIQSGCTPSQISQQWLRECWLNFLDFDEIGHFYACCFALGLDYSIYFSLAVFKHISRQLKASVSEQNLLRLLHDKTIYKGFKCRDFVEFMQDLQEKYRPQINKTFLENNNATRSEK